LYDLIRSNSSVALWNWQHHRAGVRDPGNGSIECQDSAPEPEFLG
jgi:hypothetical protein